MKNKTALVILIPAVILGISAGAYFIKKDAPAISPLISALKENDDKLQISSSSEKNGDDSTADNIVNVKLRQDEIVKDDFSIDLPYGWIEIAPKQKDISATAINAAERVSDPNAEKINFKTYFAVAHEEIKGKIMPEYAEILKNYLSDNIPGIMFTKEEDITVGGKPARAIEMELTQDGVNLKVLSIIVASKEDDFWVISFNTAKSNWDENKEQFYSIADSFLLKR